MSSVGESPLDSSPPLRSVVRTLPPPRGDKEKDNDDDETPPNLLVSRHSMAMMSHRIVKKTLIVSTVYLSILSFGRRC